MFLTVLETIMIRQAEISPRGRHGEDDLVLPQKAVFKLPPFCSKINNHSSQTKKTTCCLRQTTLSTAQETTSVIRKNFMSQTMAYDFLLAAGEQGRALGLPAHLCAESSSCRASTHAISLCSA